ASESRIRDTNMANQTVEYTKNQILTQSGVAMLAQANQRSASVLSLLQ
ncbi:MAG: flagellin, partial [Treponema sp.]|nr:flagellin [Treponema sp.]MCL2210071.1 flagellin [Treponema sp.]MCL2272591.1 flagellin [Treponema sp.]MCL2272720.1 flagellin [Treponema sp.]